MYGVAKAVRFTSEFSK